MKNLDYIILIIFLTFLFSFTNLPAQDNNRGYIVEIGQAAPDFTLTTTSGEEFVLSENKGKVVMLQFTASWCGVCRKEMPHIEKEIWLRHKDNDFVLLGIDLDEPLDVVSEFAEKMRISYPLAPDPNGDIFHLFALEGAGVTRNVIIDRKGTIVFLTRLFNETEFNAMKDAIVGLLAK